MAAADLFEVLRREHARTLELSHALEHADARDADGRRRLLEEVRTHVLAVDTLEERALYAHLEKDRRTSALADRARRENVQIEQLIEELGAIPREADTRFRQRTQLLNQRLRRHVDWEETELFRVASRLFPREAALRLGERIAAEKEELQRNLAA